MKSISINFDSWFASSYEALKQKCLPYSMFGELYNTMFEDVFHDAYLVCRDSLTGKEDDALFEVLFIAAYKAQSKHHYKADQNEVKPNDLFWAFLSVSDDDETTIQENEERKEKFDDLASKVFDYAAHTLSKDENELLCMYFKNGYSSVDIALVFGCDGSAVRYRLGQIKHVLLSRFEDDFNNLFI